ncbi:MAG TPA: alpha-L-arabinofuranosidase C-terminal domain-containing protein [Bellilinea sp.]|nr:alpha-L-arabinofuranosidase C-terminal domain-containing protein [Bellilinea sp.]
MAANSTNWQPKRSLLDLLKRPQRAILRLDTEKVIGEINPHIYGHFIEHLERCIYGGIWTENGDKLREDVLRLIQPLKPPVIRYPGGNFASAYHWEDGIGPKEQRPKRFDPAWKVEESNQVGTDEFMELCRRTGAQPYLCVNDATGTPEEAARWVAYCNEDAQGEQGQRRAANGHPEPYQVRLWGIGNEVWGDWQVGHTDAAGYVQRLRPIVEAMRAVDPTIKIVAVGDTLGADADPDARRWNETVLREAGDLINYLSFHLYQPGHSGWQDVSDLQAQYFSICAAPLSAEQEIQRLAELIKLAAPGKGIKVALDEWNVWPAPSADTASTHRVSYTMRDALYIAGILNAFQRQSKNLTLANLAQMVNVLPLIVTNERQAYATPIYYPFEMYRHMEPVALEAALDSPVYKSQVLGNIEALEKVPYIDVSATKSRSGSRVVLGIVNRHPTRRVDLSVRLYGFNEIRPKKGWLLRHSDPLAENSFANPENVKAKEVDLRQIGKKSRFTLDLPPCCVAVIALEE